MAILNFDEKYLLDNLEKLPLRARVAFAAACAERQFKNFLQFFEKTGEGDPVSLRQALNILWDDLQGRDSSSAMLNEQLELCMELTPECEGPLPAERAYAEDAVAAVAFALRTRLTGQSQEAVWAARRAYEAADQNVLRQINQLTLDKRAEKRILADAIIQTELRRQERDLSDLEILESGLSNFDETVQKLRVRAQEEPMF